MSLLSAVVVFGSMVVTFWFVLAVLGRVSAEHEVSVSVRLVPWQVTVKVGRQVENDEATPQTAAKQTL